MKMYRKISVFFTVLTLIIPLKTVLASHKMSDEEKASRRFPGIVMKAGYGSRVEQQEAVDKQQEEFNKAAHKMIAEGAKAKADVAQGVFLFIHSFLVPHWVRDLLPEDVSSRLLTLNMFDVTLNFEGTLQQKVEIFSMILRNNGLGGDLLAASQLPASKLVRLVNEVEFQPDVGPAALAKNLGELAMKLGDYENLGFQEHEANNMMGQLYYKASQYVLEALDAVDKDTLPVLQLVDFYISAGQLRRWAAYRIQDQNQSLLYNQSALDILAKAHKYAGSDPMLSAFKAKVAEEQQLAYDYLGSLLLAQGVQEGKVKAYIEKQRSKL